LSGEETRINQMIEDILADAKAEAKTILKEAEQKVKEIMQRGTEKAEKEKQTILDRQLKQINELEKQQIASINLQARQEILQKKEDEILKVFELAKTELSKFPKQAAYEKVLRELIIESGVALGGGDLLIKARKEDAAKLKDLTAIAKEITKKCGTKCTLKLAKNRITALGGVVLQTADGSVTINNTFDARLEQEYRHIRTAVAAKLFEEKASS